MEDKRVNIEKRERLKRGGDGEEAEDKEGREELRKEERKKTEEVEGK